MITRTLLLLSLIVLLVCAFIPFKTHASDLDFPHLNLQAEAQVELTPDFIRLQLQIENTHKDATVAKAFVDEVSQQVLLLGRKFEIDESNINASQIRSQPQYQWQDKKRVLLGQTISRSIDIKLYRLEDYSSLVNQLMQLNIHRYQQNGFGFDKPDLAKNQALLKALDQASTKAKLIAKHMNRKLGAVFQITEVSNFHQPLARSSMMAMADSTPKSAAPLEIKAQTVTAKVNVIYRLK